MQSTRWKSMGCAHSCAELTAPQAQARRECAVLIGASGGERIGAVRRRAGGALECDVVTGAFCMSRKTVEDGATARWRRGEGAVS
eukprot:6195881-Pleurochrysis_carterae.AAC.1